MNVWLVTPAYGRYDVTRLALSQRAHLRGELAGRGINMSCVVVAEDGNLDVAAEHGFDTLEAPNVLGSKVNAGIEYACDRGADWVCFAGSDDWLHRDLFAGTLADWGDRPPIISGRCLAIVDLVEPRLRHLRVSSVQGAAPWLMPRWCLERSRFRPALATATSGMELSIVLGLGVRPDWVFRDPHDLCRVDFKSTVSMTSYRAMQVLGVGPEVEPWPILAERYPAELVEMARQTSGELCERRVAA